MKQHQEKIQLQAEIEALRQRLAELEASEDGTGQARVGHQTPEIRQTAPNESEVHQAYTWQQTGRDLLIADHLYSTHDNPHEFFIYIPEQLTQQAAENAVVRVSDYRLLSTLSADYVYSATITSDGQSITDWATDGFSHLTGFTTEEVNAQGGWRHLIHPDDSDRCQRLFQAILSNQAGIIEYRLLTKQGKTCWLRDHLQPEWDAGQQRVVRMLGAVQDVTEDHKRRERLLENEKLSATGRLAAAIAHEINNPLAGLRNSFHLINNAIPLDHPHYGFVERIEGEIDRISAIVRHLYETYLPEHGQVREFKLGEVISDTIHQLAVLSRQYQVSLVVQGSESLEEPVQVRLPEAAIRQVLFHLFKNAIEASPPGGVVTVTLASLRSDIQVTVADQGPGIPVALHQKIFEPLFSTKGSPATPGLGLGLSLSRSLVTALGGVLDFESQQGQGSRFRILVPRVSSLLGEHA